MSDTGWDHSELLRERREVVMIYKGLGRGHVRDSQKSRDRPGD